MKLVYTLLFLLFAALNFYLGSKQQQFALEEAKGRPRAALLVYVIRLLHLTNLFFQFWILTGIFPFFLILLLTAAQAFGTIIYILLGAISGFTLEDNKRKINVLSVIWGAQNPVLACTFLITVMIAVVSSYVGSLWAFWKYNIGDPRAVVLIAFFHFVLPQLVTIPFSIASAWPIVTSEYLDDDYRNSHLAAAFSGIMYQTISLLFPVWLFKQEINDAFQNIQSSIPPFWVLLSIPLMLFILGSLLPFFVGVYRYRAQTRAMYMWQKKWLEGMLEIDKLPVGRQKDDALDEKIEELKDEISQRFSQNKLFAFYQNLVMQDISKGERPLLTDAAGSQVESTGVTTDASDLTVVSDTQVSEDRNIVKIARIYLRGRTYRQLPGGGLTESIEFIIRANQEHLVEWDMRFAHLWSLLQLYEIAGAGKTSNISEYNKARLKSVKEALSSLSPKRNIAAGAILSASSTIIVWLFKKYEVQIVELIGRLVRQAM